ncbi:beta strand repeat-containing protein [Luteolibacter soli]|uniref:Autotransporter-associated beta strand repeat-containing protein n=1 Tax=Luteolibacter soli TaxID=3135280 RepID=A0ABU9B441_9BACT
MFTTRPFPTFIALTLSALVSPASAATFYWDGTDSNSTANGGAGTWDTVSTNWDTANVSGSNIAWSNTTADTAMFGSASGTVTLVTAGTPGGTITLGGIYINSGNYVIGNVAGNGTLDFGSSTGVVNTTAQATNIFSTINSNLAGTGSPGVSIASNGDLTATGGFTTGRLTLNGTNTGLTHGMTITSGLVAFGSPAAAGSGPITLNGGGIVATTGTLTLTNAIGLSGTGVLRTFGGTTLVLSGTVSGSGSLFKTDTGTLTLSGANTYTGQTKIGYGSVNLTSFNSVNGGTPLLATSNLGAPTTMTTGTIVLGTSTTFGSITYTGTGETTDRVLEIASTNAGPTLSVGGSGLLKFTSPLSVTGLGSKALTLQGSTTGEIAGAIGDAASGSTATTAAFSSGATTITLASVDGVIIGSTISGTGLGAGTTITAINTSTRVVTISPAATGAGANGQTMIVSGVQNLTSILKTGNGTWTLSGPSTYTGQTKVNGGTLTATSLNSVNGGSPLLATSSLGAPTTVANGTITVGASTTGGTLNYTGSGETTDRVLDMAGTTGTPAVNQSGTGLLRFTSDITTSGVGSKVLTLGGATAGIGELSGVIANGLSGTTQMTSAISSGSTTVNLSSVDGVTVGSSISGTGFSAGTTITAINTGSRTVTFSPAATGTGVNGQLVTVSGVTNLTGVAKNSSGTWTLSGANTYTGVTTINGGTLIFPKPANLYQGNSAAWTTSNLVVNSGGTLGLNIGGAGEFTASDIALFDALGSSTGGLKTGAVLGLDTTNAGGTFTYSANLVNAGTSTSTGLAKLGSGTLVLSGTNTYSGGTRIDGGTLSFPALASFPTGGSVTVNAAGTLAIAGASNYGQTISGSGKITVATSTGSNTTALSGPLNNFTGIIEVSPATTGGKLSVANGSQNTIISSAATIKVLNGGTLYTSSALSYSAAVQLYGGTTGEALGQLRVENGTWSGPVTFKANTSLGASNGFNGTISGAIGDEGNGFGFTKLGTSTLTLTGSNTYKGPTSVAGGVLKANSFNSVVGGTASSGLGAPVTVADGTISLGDTTTGANLAYGGTGETTDRVINLAGTTGGGTLDQGGTGTLKFTSNLTVTGAGAKVLTLQGSGIGEFAGSIVDGSSSTALTKTGGGIWTLSGINSYTGATNSNGGTLVFANANAVPGSSRNIGSSTNGAIAFDYNTSLQTLLTTRITVGSTGGLALTANNNLAENLNFSTAGYNGYLGAKDNVTYTGTLTPNGTTVRLGNQLGGTLTLSGSNIVTGSNNLSINGNVTFTSPQTYTGTTTFTSNAGIFNGGGTQIDVSKLTLNTGTLTNLDITGSGTLTKSGTTTVTLASANSYTGGTSITDGLFIISNSSAFGAGAVTLNTSGSTTARIQLTNGVNVANTLNLGVNQGISGRGDLEINNTSSAATWSGPINITANPTNGGHFYTDATSTLTVSGPITSTVPVSFRAGNFIIPAASTSSYSSIYISGALKIGSNDALVKTADVVLANSAATTLDLNGFNQTANTVTKGTNAATITNTAATASELTINNATASTYAGIIANGTGGLSLVKSGAGDLTLGGANTYTGSTTVNAGTLILGASTLADSSTVSIASGAKLSITTASDTVTQLFLDGVQMAAGTYGATGSGAAHIDDAHFSGTGKLTVLSSSAAYTAWAFAKGLTTTNLIITADPDNDGLTNLAEFAFNTSPLSAADTPRMTPKVLEVSGVRLFTLTLAVRNGATFSGPGEQVSTPVDGVTYTIQGGFDLTDWSAPVTELTGPDAAIAQANIPAPEAGWTNRTFYIVPTGQTKAFMRAKAQD